MRNNEIHSAFLIRVLARSEPEHCDHCGSRMYVKADSGLCPFCLNDRPPKVVYRGSTFMPPLPVAPRLARRLYVRRDVRGWMRQVLTTGTRAPAASSRTTPSADASASAAG